MISITTKSPYALKALTELGRQGGDTPVPIGELAKRRDIPVQFLEQLFATLRRAGVLKSQRGVKGDYSFARDPSEITRVAGRGPEGQLATVDVSPPRSPALNPAFDVTPARLVTGLVTERGICAASAEGLRALYPERGADARS